MVKLSTFSTYLAPLNSIIWKKSDPIPLRQQLSSFGLLPPHPSHGWHNMWTAPYLWQYLFFLQTVTWMNKHTQQTEKKFHFHFLNFLICCLQFCLASLHWAFLPPLLTAASWVAAAKNVQHGLLQAQCKSKSSWNIWIGEPQTRCCTVQDYMVSMGLL